MIWYLPVLKVKLIGQYTFFKCKCHLYLCVGLQTVKTSVQLVHPARVIKER